MGLIEQLKREAEDITPSGTRSGDLNKLRRGSTLRFAGMSVGAMTGAIIDRTAGSFPFGIVMGLLVGDVVAIKAGVKIKALNRWIKSEPTIPRRD